MSQGVDSGTRPLYERDSAEVDRADDVALLVLRAAGDDGLTPNEVHKRVQEFEAIEYEFDSVGECFDSLEMFGIIGYTSDPRFGPERVTLEEKGQRAADALANGVQGEPYE